MRELGYVEGQNYGFEDRYADGDLNRLPKIASELMELKPDVIVVTTMPAVMAFSQLTKTTPIVCGTLNDPTGFGVAFSLARPGGNVTGLLSTLDSLPAKQFEIGLQVLPRAKRIAMLVNTASSLSSVFFRRIEPVAASRSIALVSVEVSKPADLDAAFQSLASEQIELLFVPQDSMFLGERRRLAALALAARIPTMCCYREHVEDGGFMSYGIDLQDSFRRAAPYVVKILKGERPSDLPIEFPTKLELFINQRTAKTLGLSLSRITLAQADGIID